MNSGRRPIIPLGPYGTGTNWVASTLAKSGARLYWDAGSNAAGKRVKAFFKHYVIEEDTLSILTPPDDALFVCTLKSPLFWFSSLRRMVEAKIAPAPDLRKLVGAPMSEFIRAPGRMVGARREIKGEAFVHYRDLADFWNRYASGYQRHLPGDRVHIVAYEKAIRDPRAAFGAILERVGIAEDALCVYEGRRFARPDGTGGVGHDLREAQAYYGDDRNRLAPFDEQDLAFVAERIDAGLLSALGYESDGSAR